MQQSRRNAEQGRQREQEPLHLPTDNAAGGGDAAVARRAYQRYEERGYEHGRDMDDWLEAEREVRRAEPAERQSERSGQSQNTDGSNEAA